MMNRRQHIRQPVERQGKLAMTVIPFEKMEKIVITAHTIDMGSGGLGITADYALKPGFVVIHDGTRERKNGVLVWSKELDDKTYRAGIQFIPAHLKKAEHFQDKVQPSHSFTAFQDPRLVATILVEEIEQPGEKTS